MNRLCIALLAALSLGAPARADIIRFSTGTIIGPAITEVKVQNGQTLCFSPAGMKGGPEWFGPILGLTVDRNAPTSDLIAFQSASERVAFQQWLAAGKPVPSPIKKILIPKRTGREQFGTGPFTAQREWRIYYVVKPYFGEKMRFDVYLQSGPEKVGKRILSCDHADLGFITVKQIGQCEITVVPENVLYYIEAWEP